MILLTLFFLLIFYVVLEVNHRQSTYYKITHVPYFRTRMDVGRNGEYLTYRHKGFVIPRIRGIIEIENYEGVLLCSIG